MRKHPPEAQPGPTRESSRLAIETQPAHDTPEELVRFQGRQDIPAIRLVAAAAAKPKRAQQKTRTPRQEARLVRLEETRESRDHVGDTTPLPATPQGLYHWEQSDQIAALTEARLAEAEPSFMMRLLALCSLPRTDPGNASQYTRTNGRFELVMARSARPGLPYGTVPRIVLAWMCTEAVRTRRRQLTLGSSFSSFMDKIAMRSSDSGGRHGVRTRVHTQMIRLFSASISLTECGPDQRPRRGMTAAIVDAYDLWWDPICPAQAGLWNSQIVLGERFFAEVLAYPVPIDLNVLRAMRRSPLGLDTYLWLTYRFFTLGQRSTQIPWTALYDQFGAHPGRRDRWTITAFRADFLRELKKLGVAWPGLNYATPRGYLVLGPTAPLIPPSD